MPRIVTCATCNITFDRGYAITPERARNNQFCSPACYSAYPREKRTAELFWRKVDIRTVDECWPWTGCIRPNGYGWFNFAGRPMTASRAAYILTNGSISSDIFVCHSCDNPPCCNPSHLWAGTCRENTHDMLAKGRGKRAPVLRGVEHPTTKLTPEQALEAYSSSEPCKALGEKFGVTAAAIDRIRRGKSWAHLTGAKS